MTELSSDNADFTEPDGLVFNIERHALHDGPGIRTLVFLMGCPLRCDWCSNPEGQDTRPVLIYDREKCTLCAACRMACRFGAVAVEAGRLANDRTLCTGCGTCISECPVGARRVAGRWMSVGNVMEVIQKDEVFYRHSLGGVTVSGGEPLLQARFLQALFDRCRLCGIHTAVETCGAVPRENIELILPVTDLFLYDVKHMDTERHRQATGEGNEQTLDNLAALSAAGAQIIIRVPVVPGFNDSALLLKAIVEHARSLRTVREVHLLPYHRLGTVKYRKLERDDPMGTAEPVQVDSLKRLAEEISVPGIDVHMDI